ncbi:cobalt-precorrin-5B (C(1))-methyltransferase [Arhodomonas sp. AD133]|uniref:cobalt-precorrin-5B (C(1))-methyltransferase n=1 Tax=Arhodomonas sp. AD133 TaxID=3415009 RepID=UPI003EC0D33E
MRPETPERRGPLRTGFTTGVCATAAAVAAARLTLTGFRLGSVHVTLPRGRSADMAIHDLSATNDGAEAGVIKDGGDDPDATHGARVWARVIPEPEEDVRFRAGAGVGTVTRSGLTVPVGEPAINPVPRRMIREHLLALADEHGHAGGFSVTVGVDDGERIAQRTMNARLGILGGLSILGTTGIVRPFSCAAYIASIHQSVDVARANGLERIAGCTGSTSEAFVRTRYGLGDMALVEMGDLVGALLKHVRRHPVPAVILAGGFGKLSKFAAGHLDTHSRKAPVDFDFLAAQAGEAGAETALRAEIASSNTSMAALTACQAAGIPLGQRICALAAAQARGYLPAGTALTVCAVDRQGEPVGIAEAP